VANLAVQLCAHPGAISPTAGSGLRFPSVSAVPVLETSSGRIQGVPGRNGGTAFLGIPYAAPPVGPRRFRAPVAPLPWSGIRQGDKPGPICAQALTALERMQGITDDQTSEDCLYLNIFTPSLEGRRPVMVWLHGGAFVNGAGSLFWYEGSNMATLGDVVVVSINYRLGAFGYSALWESGEDFAESANVGLLDQIAALRWVAEHAGAIGGDPGRVCLFGESAGAMSIGALLATPEAKGLFAAAALQSGAGANVLEPERAMRTTAALYESVGITPGDVRALVDLPAAALVDMQERLVREHHIGMPFAPAVDGVVLTRQPLEALRDGAAAQVSLIAGSNLEELRLFGVLDPVLRSLDWDEVRSRARRILPDRADEVLNVYASNRPGATPADVWGAVFGDYLFRIPAIRLAEAAGDGGGKCWSYLFTWSSDSFGGQLGCCHAMEIPFVFENLDLPGVSLFTGEGEGRHRLARDMRRSWTELARSGDPGHEEIGSWPPYGQPDRSTMIFGATSELVSDPAGDERILWD
jgi:para-nitrobenzyl esterase